LQKVRNSLVDAQVLGCLVESQLGLGEFRAIIERQASGAFPESAVLLHGNSSQVITTFVNGTSASSKYSKLRDEQSGLQELPSSYFVSEVAIQHVNPPRRSSGARASALVFLVDH
jgi:hypothetical protein